MLPDGRRLGAHLPLGGGMLKAVDRAVEIGAEAIQIFTDNPTAWARRAAPPPELPTFRERIAAAGIRPVVAHASYLVNLAGPDSRFFGQSVRLLAEELRSGPAFGVRYVNVHIGSHRGTTVEAGIERLAEGVAATFTAVYSGDPLDGPVPMLVLENSAGGGWGLGVDIDELAEIAAALERIGMQREQVGFCIDVAHAWGAGVDMSEPGAIDAFLREFDERLGLDRLRVIHLNDSRSAFGSRLDRHEHIGAGRIGPVGLGHLVRHPDLGDVAFILETPGMEDGYDAINLARTRDLADGRPLPTLPPEAFTLRGSRARSAPA